jgi:hypothetical protein
LHEVDKDHFSYIDDTASQVLGSWVYPAERTTRVVDPVNLIQTMLAKGTVNSQLNALLRRENETKN